MEAKQTQPLIYITVRMANNNLYAFKDKALTIFNTDPKQKFKFVSVNFRTGFYN